jgi:hypothetical protein
LCQPRPVIHSSLALKETRDQVDGRDIGLLPPGTILSRLHKRDAVVVVLGE